MLFCPFAAEASADTVTDERAADVATDDIVYRARHCHSDDECVPAAVCHPRSCDHRRLVPPEVGPCTLECRPGTLDCGQGHCECFARHCVAVID